MRGMPVANIDKKQEQQWQTDEDVRTLARAAEIQADPARMKRCQTALNEQQKGLDQARMMADPAHRKMMTGKAMAGKK